MNVNELPNQLSYLREYPLGSEPSGQRRNAKLVIDRRRQRKLYDSGISVFTWRATRHFESGDNASYQEGVWPINHARLMRRIGCVPRYTFSRDDDFLAVPREIYSEANHNRLFSYRRALNSTEAKRAILSGSTVTHATELTTEWYDPPHGIIRVDRENPEVLGAHDVCLTRYLPKYDLFVFANSWGGEWGREGEGGIEGDHFDRFQIESWQQSLIGMDVPLQSKQGIVCLEWKHSFTMENSLHGREIVDAETSDRLAWAFCVRRNQSVDVEEFFVWPTERGNGHARTLALMVLNLARELGLPLRMLVPFADTYEENIEGVRAVARMLGLALTGSKERCAHMLGVASPTSFLPVRNRPMKPAFPLEWLRRSDEPPVIRPIDYVVHFGTNRARIENATDQVAFTGLRGSELSLGSASVQIPKSCRFGSSGRAWRKIWDRILKRLPRVAECEMLEHPEFQRRTTLLAEPFGEDAHHLIYVHGYNVPFSAALTQAARFGVDLKIPGATFLYSWPSAGKLGSYAADEAAIEASLSYFKEFVNRILDATANDPITLLVHSMGNRLVARYLAEMAKEVMDEANSRIRHVLFAAPDVDADVFREAARMFPKVARRSTMYGSRADWALQASSYLHGYHRAGLFPPVTIVDGLETIVVEGFDLLNLGHDYYAEASDVLHDMFNLIHFDAKPAQRAKVEAARTAGGADYWRLPL